MKALKTVGDDFKVADVWPLLKGSANGGTTEQHSSEIGKRIDYIIMGQPVAKTMLRPVSIEVALFQDPKVTALSDHNAVVAEFAWATGGGADP